MSRILIADDHAVVRAGLRRFLLEDSEIREVGEAGTANQTLDRLRESRWDLLLLDIYMPERSGLDVLRQVSTGFPSTRVLIVSGLPERQYAANALRAGADGYLAKDSDPEQFLRAVHMCLRGKRYVSENLAELLIDELDADRGKPLHARLSPREFQIFCKIAIGRPPSEIARDLCLSVKTVSTYRRRTLEKMKLVTNADITAYALRNGLVL
jgi:two-component system, NarL family, invasion response regulator UvrY